MNAFMRFGDICDAVGKNVMPALFLVWILAMTFLGASGVGALVQLAVSRSPEALATPSQAVPDRVSWDYFVPTLSDCPPRGECPRVKIDVRHGDRDAFIRHLHLAVLRHGGSYDLQQGQDDVFTVRLPQEAVAELRQLRGAPYLFRRAVTDGYQPWATRWSGESAPAPAPAGSADAPLATVSIKVMQESLVKYYGVAIFFVLGLGCIAMLIGMACLSARLDGQPGTGQSGGGQRCARPPAESRLTTRAALIGEIGR